MRKLYAEMWRCDDEECDCTQPQIIERSEEPYGTPLWRGPELIEQGAFCSYSDAKEIAGQWAELLALAEKYKVVNLEDVKIEYQKWYS